MRLLFSRKALEQEARSSENIAVAARRRQVETADGTPEGDRESAIFRTEANEEEAHASRARQAARTPAWRRRPLPTPPAYLAQQYGRD